MAHKCPLNSDNKQTRATFASAMLFCIKSYRENVPVEIQDKITFGDLKGLEKRCHQILDEK